MSFSKGKRAKANWKYINDNDDFPSQLHEWLESHNQDQIFTIVKVNHDSDEEDRGAKLYTIENDDGEVSPEGLYAQELIEVIEDWDE